MFSDLSLLDVEGERASTIEEHRRRISRNRDALHQMHNRGLLEMVEGPAYDCFRLTEEGRARQASSETG